MTPHRSARRILSLHRPAWRAVCEILAEHGAHIPLRTRLLYGWRGHLLSTAWALAPRAPVGHSLPVGCVVAGFWRSGTTLLHECLSFDGQWRAPTTQECMNPGQPGPTIESARVQRPMDQLVIDATTPQEDEFALLALGAPSFYRVLLCPRAWPRLLAELRAGGAAETWHERATVIRDGLAWFASRDPRPLLLKSPTHAFALSSMLELAPAASAIVIVRDGAETFRSNLGMWKSMFELYSLDSWNDDDVTALVTSSYVAYADALQRELSACAAHRVAVVRYEDFVAAPAAALQAVYRHLRLLMPDGFPALVEAHVEATRPAARKSTSPRESGGPSAGEIERVAEQIDACTSPFRVALEDLL